VKLAASLLGAVHDVRERLDAERPEDLDRVAEPVLDAYADHQAVGRPVAVEVSEPGEIRHLARVRTEQADPLAVADGAAGLGRRLAAHHLPDRLQPAEQGVSLRRLRQLLGVAPGVDHQVQHRRVRLGPLPPRRAAGQADEQRGSHQRDRSVHKRPFQARPTCGL